MAAASSFAAETNERTHPAQNTFRSSLEHKKRVNTLARRATALGMAFDRMLPKIEGGAFSDHSAASILTSGDPRVSN
eukprot:3799124-Rhodomonas_salina.1